jgi:glucans biosynthesis protein C
MPTLSSVTTEMENINPQTARAPERFYSLDALRAFALLLGIFFHSLLADALPPGIWAVGTTTPQQSMLWFVSYSHSFRMEIFFLLAGFFARLVIGKRGTSAYLRDRAQRILLVFFVALYPMKWMLTAVWISGGLKTGWLSLPPDQAQLPLWLLAIGGLGLESWPKINLTHLWFLYYLWWIALLFIGGRWLIQWAVSRSAVLAHRLDTGYRWLATSWGAPLFLALGLTPVLAMMSGSSVDTPDNSFAWNIPVLILYGCFFTGGWWLHRQVDLLEILAPRWKVFLPLSLLASVLMAVGGSLLSASGPVAHGPSHSLRWATALGTGLVMNLAVLGWLGLFIRLFSRPSPKIRYLADSSYWLYVAHLPLVTGLQVWAASWPQAWWIKLLIINAITFPVLLLSYHFCIRFTWIGAWLNGHRVKRL